LPLIAQTFEDEAFIDLVQNGYNEGFKGYSVGANYALAKNIVAGVTYYDLESKEAEGTPDAQTLWSQVVFTF